MTCETCGRSTKVVETRETFDGAIFRRMRQCGQGHMTTTYEIPQKMFNAAKHDIKKVLAGREYVLNLQRLAEQKELMVADRLDGLSCPALAVKYKMSVHMARYYTRISRGRLYPGARK